MDYAMPKEFMVLLEGATKAVKLKLREPMEERAQRLADTFEKDIIFVR